MTGDLTHCTEDQLMRMVLNILAACGPDGHVRPLTAWDETELEQIETELHRRGSFITAYDNLR